MNSLFSFLLVFSGISIPAVSAAEPCDLVRETLSETSVAGVTVTCQQQQIEVRYQSDNPGRGLATLNEIRALESSLNEATSAIVGEEASPVQFKSAAQRSKNSGQPVVLGDKGFEQLSVLATYETLGDGNALVHWTINH